MKVKAKLLVVEAEGSAENYDRKIPFLMSFETSIKKQLNPLLSTNFTILLLCISLNDRIEMDNHPILKNYTEELKEIKRNYPHCIKLIQVNENSETILQYDENTQELDKEFQDIKNSYGSFTFNVLQHLRQCVLQKFNSTKAISTAENSATVSTNAEASLERSYVLQKLRQHILQKFNSTKAISTAENSATVSTNAEASLERSYVLQKLRQHILQKSTIKLNSSDITTPILETSSKRKTTLNDQINSNLPFRKRKLQRNFKACTKSSSKLTIPNIPNKLTSILEIIHYWGRDILL
ncbi:hypothetical protein [Candidatus Mesenet endosymbiont of Agriotes lineatus]|uniref:hypothetical protein n=1 Tax=Candidatus Mesenet endosymbiont of Agriotes lineatus TaxID=3077948 RepID=UPI0030CCD0D5